MSEEGVTKARIDRRSFVKIMGSAGATAVFVSTCAPPALGAQSVAPTATTPLAGPGKTISLATTGPGANPDYVSTDDLKFLPPERIPSGQAADLFATLPKEKLLTTYERMVKSRKWETRMKDLFLGGKDGLYGAFHMYVGEEAIANGVAAALHEDDYIVSTHRGHGHLVAKGADLNKMSAEIFFKETGANHGYGGSVHLVEVDKGILGMNGIVAAAFYIAAGAAYSAWVRGTKQVAVAFAGDGAANSVYYFSAVRNAALYKLPVIFVIENNFLQELVPMATVTPTKQISDYTKGLGIPSVTIDGNDVAQVYATTQAAVDRARSGAGPTVIEALTYRWYDDSRFGGARVGVDGAFGLFYRSDDVVRQWMSRDPILRYKTFLVEKNLATNGELTAIDRDAQAAVEASVEFARKSPGRKPEDGLKNVYAEGSVRPTQFFGARA